MFRVDLVIDIGIETAEAVIASVVSDIGPDGLRFGVHQIHDAGRSRAVVIVNHAAVNGAKLRIAFLVLGKSACTSRRKNQEGCDKE